MQAIRQERGKLENIQYVNPPKMHHVNVLIDYFCKLHLAGPDRTWKESLERWLTGSSAVIHCYSLGSKCHRNSALLLLL